MEPTFTKNLNTQYVFTLLALIGVFWMLSLTEVYFSNTVIENYFALIFYKFTADFWACIIIGILFFPVFYGLRRVLKKYAISIIKILFVILIILQFSLIKYSLVTKLNLGADILGYSLDDALMTVSTSEAFSVTSLIPFIIFPSLLFGFYFLIKKLSTTKKLKALSLILILLFGVSKLVLTNKLLATNQNKTLFLAHDIIKFNYEKTQLGNTDFTNRTDYPLLKKFEVNKDVLSPFFSLKDSKPNFVFIVVEGLGGEFVDNNIYSGFTPFIDSLLTESLYWKNFVSNTGRSFGILPSLFGSLPYGEKGFLEEKNTPSHLSLISILKANNYQTNYYSGGPAEFDRKVNFLDYNGVDNIIDIHRYGNEYTKTENDKAGFSWGFPDHEIFKKALSSLDAENQPRLDIVMTLSTHEPFIYPNQKNYKLQVASQLESLDKSVNTKALINNNKDIFGCLLYTDASLKTFMNAYKNRPDYENTIFVITGDHRLIPISQKDKLCRFHVPFAIFSPLLKSPETFKSVSSHWDVTPSLLQLLFANYPMNALEQTNWMGEGLDTTKTFVSSKKIPLMRYKGSINDYIFNDYLFSEGALYKINPDFTTSEENEERLLKTIQDSLVAFKIMNSYVTTQDKIFPKNLNVYATPKTSFTADQMDEIDRLTKGKTFDDILILARDLAHEKKYNTAQLLCNYIINEYPNYTDARVLKGRSLAWEKQYKAAESTLLKALKRAPTYEDTYAALLDVYWWWDQENKSENIYKQALKNSITNPQIGFKMAKAYSRIENQEKAKSLLDSLITIHPDIAEFQTFKSALN